MRETYTETVRRARKAREPMPLERACQLAAIMLERVTLTNYAGETVFEVEQARAIATLKAYGRLREGTLPDIEDCLPAADGDTGR